MRKAAPNRQPAVPPPGVQRRPRRKRRIRKLRLFALTLFCAALFFATVYFSMLVFFNIDTVLVEGGERYSEEEISLASGIRTGESIMKVDKPSVAGKLEKELPYIETARIRLRLPSTVEISVTETLPSMAVELDGEYYLLSPEFKLLEKCADLENKSLPVVVGISVSPCEPGDFMEFEDNTAKEILLDMFGALIENDMLKDIRQVDLTDRFGITAQLSDELEVYFGSSADIGFKLKFCRDIALRLTQGEKGVIDVSDIKKASFRFKN